jgi:hypothetical protein
MRDGGAVLDTPTALAESASDADASMVTLGTLVVTVLAALVWS